MMTNYKNLSIRSEFTGSKEAKWSGNQSNWNHHRVTVRNRDTRKSTSFDFWGSIMNPEIRTENEVLQAFECFVSDAISGTYDFEGFCNEFDYDIDSRKAERIWKECQKSNRKLQRVYDGDIYDLSNDLNK